jgi:hypothetical protein
MASVTQVLQVNGLQIVIQSSYLDILDLFFVILLWEKGDKNELFQLLFQ